MASRPVVGPASGDTVPVRGLGPGAHAATAPPRHTSPGVGVPAEWTQVARHRRPQQQAAEQAASRASPHSEAETCEHPGSVERRPNRRGTRLPPDGQHACSSGQDQMVLSAEEYPPLAQAADRSRRRAPNGVRGSNSGRAPKGGRAQSHTTTAARDQPPVVAVDAQFDHSAACTAASRLASLQMQ